MKLLRLSLLAITTLLTIHSATAQIAKEHTLQQGETLSALAAKYNTTVGDIMRLNGMNAKSQLVIGQKIKIPNAPVPSVGKQIPQTNTSTPTNNSPLTHTVTKGDNMYRLTKTYNVSDVQIRNWNNLADNNIQIGQLLVVGNVPNNYKPPVVAKDIIKVAEPASNRLPGQIDNPTNESTVIKTEVPPTNTDFKKVAEPASNKLPGQTDNPTEEKKQPETPVYKEPTVVSGSDKYVNKEGFFAQYFDRKQSNENTIKADASIFKSVSGWTDKKYYVLINDVTPGTVVRVTANGKSICAKVLGPLPAMKDDNGLRFRISNAAQNVLGLETDRFEAVLNY